MQKNTKIPFDTIVAAKAGDPDVLEKILNHYAPFIAKLSKEEGVDAHGRPYEVINEDVKAQLEAKLLMQIVMAYDLTKQPPAGEPNGQ